MEEGKSRINKSIALETKLIHSEKNNVMKTKHAIVVNDRCL